MDCNNSNKNKFLLLTPREQEVARLLCQGMTAKASAAMLQIKQKTVEKHIEKLKIKTGCRNKFELNKILEKFFL